MNNLNDRSHWATNATASIRKRAEVATAILPVRHSSVLVQLVYQISALLKADWLRRRHRIAVGSASIRNSMHPPRFIRLLNSRDTLLDWLSFSIFDCSSQTISCVSAAAEIVQTPYYFDKASNSSATAVTDEREGLARALVSDRANHCVNQRESDFACNPLTAETSLSYLLKTQRISTLLTPHLDHCHLHQLASHLC